MATEHPHHHGTHGDDGAGPLNHETTDIPLEGVGRIALGFILISCVVVGIMFTTYRMLDRRSTGQPSSPVEYAADIDPAVARELTTPGLMDAPNEADRVGRPAAGPKMLTNEPLWLTNFRTQQHEVLSTYGWVDKEAGVVRLPIERAMELIVERGLPQTGAPAEPAPAEPAPTEGAPAVAPGAELQ